MTHKLQKVYEGDQIVKRVESQGFVVTTCPADGLVIDDKIYLRLSDIKDFYATDADLKEIDSWRKE